MNKPPLQQGFSLMELMVVIAIIGILVAIAIPSYQVYTRRAHFTEVVNATQPYKLAVQECYQVTGELANCAAGTHGIPKAIADNNKQSLINAINVANGIITVVPNNKYGITNQDTYVLTPVINRGMLSWKTSGGAVAEGYVN